MALVGLMQTLALEGARNNIRVNCIAPTAATQMLEGLLPQAERDLLRPGHVSPGVLNLVGEDAPTRAILCAGAGSFEAAHVTLTPGIFVGDGLDAPETILASWPKIVDRDGEFVPETGGRQLGLELENAGYKRAAKGTSWHARRSNRLHGEDPNRPRLSWRLQRDAGADACGACASCRRRTR
jgi:hypothetical protein